MLKKLLFVSFTTLALTACGGGDSDSSGSYPQPATPTVNGGECQTADNGNVIWGVAGGSCTFKSYPESDILTMTCTADGKITINTHALDVNTDGSFTLNDTYTDSTGKLVSSNKTAVCPH